jgi:hypothetical protein
MSENLSSNAMIYAILALDGEIASQSDYIANGDIPADEREAEEDTLGDLQQALMEFVEVYKKRCKLDKDLPSIDELLTSEL